MRNKFDAQCQDLRTRIARSRRRLDRRAQDAAGNMMQMLPFPSLTGRGSRKWWVGALAVAVVLSWWSRPPRLVETWRRQFLGTTLARGLDQLTRRLRVMAWQSRRARRAAAEEASDE
jgi:hypothetical protein